VRRVLAVGDHPADDVAAEDVEDDVQVEVRPLDRSEELCDVPRPDLIRRSREELGLRVLRVRELVAALADLAGGGKDAVRTRYIVRSEQRYSPRSSSSRA
jgi:hypothetical protein